MNEPAQVSLAGRRATQRTTRSVDVREGKLVGVLTRWAVPMGDIFLLYPSARHLPKKTVALRDHVTEALRGRFKDCRKAP